MKSKYWIILTSFVVVGVSIYLIVGINKELSDNSHINDSSKTNSQSSVSNSTYTTSDTYKTQNENNSNPSISAIQTYYNKLIESNKVDANDIGDFNTFSNTINKSNVNDVKNLYNVLKSKGFSENEIGNLDNFYTTIENLMMNVNTDVSSLSTEQANNNNTVENTNSENHAYNKSPYKGNQLSNGSSPLERCFGKGVYGGNATLTVKNGSSSDAIVCLYNVSKDRTIRNEYIQRNSNFKISNIAQGYYKIRVLYGNDWNPTLENSCGSKGNFESDVSFSEFDGQQYFEDNGSGYTIATITLYTVSGGNASTSSISQSEFFNK